MSHSQLEQLIASKKAKLAVIGLGYVGLPVAAIFAEKGFNVLGIEIRADRVNMINAGKSPIEGDEPGLTELLQNMVGSKKMQASSNYEDLRDRDIILIDVETPVDESHTPRYAALKNACKNLASVLKPGALVIIESTIAPGTMKGVVLPLLEEKGLKLNQDFYLGNCPERVMPGKLLSNLRAMSRVCGGDSPSTAAVMISLYRNIVEADLDSADWTTAELVKTVENTYRDVQIAFANEVALICEQAGADILRVRELVNKSPFRQMHIAGAGVGGHCIPKDPWLLAYAVQGSDVTLRLIPAARAINDKMPHHMIKLVEKALARHQKKINQSKILVMGYAYLENSDDIRNSPSAALVGGLDALGAEVVIHDPYVEEYKGDFLTMASGCDAAIIMVRHDEYLKLDLSKLKSRLTCPILIDGRRVFEPQNARAVGFDYSGIGLGD
ncbi:MAG TPA: nucleotide sugar dehydrogenase [Leptolinea sp.]